MRQKIVAGNWKMNKNYEDGLTLAKDVIEGLTVDHCTVVLGTPFIHLKAVSEIVKNVENVYSSAQNCSSEPEGAYTGEVSAEMIKSSGADYIIIGHSERRAYFTESDEVLAKKIDLTLQNKLIPIFCCGETFEERETEQHFTTVKRQINNALFHLSEDQLKNIVIAYEPVWAIGTGKTATPEQAQEMHQHIRSLISDRFGDGIADDLSILYGGSCKPSNATELFSQKDLDGGLIGGASLNASDFIEIIANLKDY
ncbi:MAG: triose-phosphate isomerase [Bacteroidetes bacterium]|nr:MAG: triose-phosphate isomerase [Bacteroidota bacterium]